MRRFWNHTCGDSRATARVRERWVFPVPAQSLQTLSRSRGSLAYFPGSIPLLSGMGQGAQKLAGLLEHTLHSQKNLLFRVLCDSSDSDSTLLLFFPPPKPTFYLPLSTHPPVPSLTEHRSVNPRICTGIPGSL